MIIQNKSHRKDISVVVFGCIFLSCGVLGCQTPSSGPGPGRPPFSQPPFASPSATIPPPKTGSYTVGDAVAYANPNYGSPNYGNPNHNNPSYPPSSPQSPSDRDREGGYDNGSEQDTNGIQPFQHRESTYSASAADEPPVVPSVGGSREQWSATGSQPPQRTEPESAVQPFQSKNTNITAGSVTPGSMISGSALTASPGMGDRIEIPPSAFRTESGMRISPDTAFANTRGSSSVTQTAFIAPSATQPLPDSQSPGLTQPAPVYADKVE